MANLGQGALDGDPVTTYRDAVAECRAAFRAAGALDRTVDYPFGPVPGPAVAWPVRGGRGVGVTGPPASVPADQTPRQCTWIE